MSEAGASEAESGVGAASRAGVRGSGPVLILGGTAEGRALAASLKAPGIATVTSLAGAVRGTNLPGRVRIGGFGGVTGLTAYLRAEGIARVVDATHPFAATMTAHAHEACRAAGVPLLRLQRPSWSSHPDAPTWHWVDDAAAALALIPTLGRRPFLALGRQGLEPFRSLPEALARLIGPLDDAPAGWTIVTARGPFALDAEMALMREQRVDVLVTKDAGGSTDAKLDAARTLGVPVVVIRRPPLPAGLDVVADVGSAAAWARGADG